MFLNLLLCYLFFQRPYQQVVVTHIVAQLVRAVFIHRTYEGMPGQWKFIITDNGEGMLPEVTERIFLPFFTTKPGGSGIGLALCKQITVLHGGQIAVTSEPDKGSTFTLTFPV